jgi:signal transduction histidine kinase/predicted negative regulator of RcsB-dependent stress response
MRTLKLGLFVISVMLVYRPAQSQSVIDSLESVLEETASDSLRCRLLHELAAQYTYINFSRAEDYADMEVKLAEQKNWGWAKVKGYKSGAILARSTGNYTKALKMDNLELQEAILLKDSVSISEGLNFMGYDYGDLGEYDEAYYYFTQSFRVARRLNDSLKMAIAIHNVGSVFKELGQYDVAIEHLDLSLKISEKIKDDQGQAFYLDEVGDVYLRKGEYDKAEEALRTSLKESRAKNIGDLEPRTLSKLARLYLLKNELTKASLYYDSAALLHQKTDNDYGLAGNNLGKGEVLMQEGKYSDALHAMEESLKSAKELTARKMESECFNQLSLLEEKRGDFKRSLEYYKNYKILSDSLFGQEMVEKLFQNQLRFETETKDFEIASLSQAKAKRDSEIKKQEFIRNILVVTLALTAILLFTIYRSGQRRIEINKLLMTHQDEIKKRSVELAQLNEVKDKFFSIISHDLRSPMNALSGVLNLLQNENLRPEEFKKLTQELRVQFNHTKALINNLLDWALLQMDKLKIQPEKIDLKKLVDENFKMLSSMHLKETTLKNQIEEGTIAFADLNMINLVIRNLLMNGIKFTETGGVITAWAEEKNNQYVISIQDNGVGISPDVQKILFEKTSGYSTRGTANEKGTGLGLILCKEFIEKNGGKIWLVSELGKGSTFSFTLNKA